MTKDVCSEIAAERIRYTDSLAKELKVSYHCAENIIFLRNSSKWTQELEDKIIQMDKDRQSPPDVKEWVK